MPQEPLKFDDISRILKKDRAKRPRVAEIRLENRETGESVIYSVCVSYQISGKELETIARTRLNLHEKWRYGHFHSYSLPRRNVSKR